MDSSLGLNIRYLRKSKGLTQDQLADKIGVNRAMIGSYEEGRAVPKLSALSILSHYFGVSIDSLVKHDLSTREATEAGGTSIDASGKRLRVLTTVIDREDKEQITLVPVKASAGYLSGYADPDYIETLPRFSLPLPELGRERTYRAFQISGDSMEPLPSGIYIISEYVQNWNDIKEGKTYIVVSLDDGLAYKRVYKGDKALILKSDNPKYAPYSISLDSVTEVWKALGYISFALPEPDEMNLGKLSAMFYELKTELESLKEKNK